MAFSEGFAECLEIVTKDLMGYKPPDDEPWDCAYGIEAWLSNRDQQLREHAVKNNRFIYQTATPYLEDFSRRHRLKASEPPKPYKPTQKSALEKSNAGLPLTPEEQELYNRY